MSLTGAVLLPLALDVPNAARALEIAEAVHPQSDIAEIDTPLVIEEGLKPLETLKRRFPDKQFLADLKIMDAVFLEAGNGFSRGADNVTVLAAADDRTVAQALEAASRHGGRIMVDLINQADPVARARRLQDLGVQMICTHMAYDRQGAGIDPLRALKGSGPRCADAWSAQRRRAWKAP
ncbi:MAG TPA: orotidine 5'-phosphate decarboxylase / HUMPS family protein [Bryobacteraceae bacterium]|nr:orotidine 5'-phosphate decarboxylase / HUMPS family protein [Bryobacteraceae bacterium]